MIIKYTLLFTFVLLFVTGCAKTREEKELKVTDDEISIQLESSVFPSKKYTMKSKSNGKVVRIYSQVGDKIQKGDLLYSLDTGLIDLEIKNQEKQIQLQKQLKHTILSDKQYLTNISDVNLASLELKKYSFLYAEGLISESELNIYKKQYLNTLRVRDEMKRTQAERISSLNLSMMNTQHSLKKLNYELRNSESYAEFDGFITDIFIEQDSYVEKDLKICTIVNIDTVIVKAGIATGLLPFVKEGKEVTITFVTAPPIQIISHITKVTPIVDKTYNTLTIDMVVPNPTYALQEGTRALVKVRLSREGQERVRKYFINNRNERIIQVQSDI